MKNKNIPAIRFKQIVLFTTCFLLLPGYVVQHYLGVEANTLFFILSSLCLLIVLQNDHGRISHKAFTLIFGLCVIGAVGSFFSGVFSQILMTASFSLSFYVAWSGWRMFTDHKALKCLTVFCWILVIGAIIAFFYALAGGQPMTVIDLFGRRSYFYLTTFTNAVSGNLIRPAGIFDEPGALAMYITLVVALNEALGVGTKKTAALLFAGLITGSFALLFVAVSYLLFKVLQKKIVLVVMILLTVGGLLASNERLTTPMEKFYVKRLQIVDGQLVGDNRTHQIESFFREVNWDITLKGQKALGYANKRRDISSNPFSIYYGYGIFVWLPYLTLLIWLLYCTIMYHPNLRFPAFALFLTLLQRPYIFNLHWGMMIAVVAVTIYRVQKSRSKVTIKRSELRVSGVHSRHVLS